MMLVKRLCMACVSRSRVFPTGKSPWVSIDDFRWDSAGIVLCPCDLVGKGTRVHVYMPPPKGCPYVLEHAIEEQP